MRTDAKMRKWLLATAAILTGLALFVGGFLVLSEGSAKAAPAWSDLQFDGPLTIDAGPDGIIDCGEVFFVTGVISNNGDDESVATVVSYTLSNDFIEGAPLPIPADAGDPEKGIDLDDRLTVQWAFTCTQFGSTVMTWTMVSQNNFPLDEPVLSEPLVVSQGFITITKEPPAEDVYVGDEFTETIWAEAPDCGDFEVLITPTVTTAGDVTCDPIEEGKPLNTGGLISWVVDCECTGPITAENWVTAEAVWVGGPEDGNMLDASLIYDYPENEDAMVEVPQLKPHLVATWPEDFEQGVGDPISDLKLNIANTGNTTAYNIEVEFGFDGPVTCTSNLVDGGSIGPGANEDLTGFECTCEGMGPATFWVEMITATYGADTDNYLVPQDNIEYPTEDLTVHQIAVPEIKIIEPSTTEWGKDQEFQVTAWVHNPYDFPLDGVWVELMLPDGAKITKGDKMVGLGHLQPGVEEWVTWMIMGEKETCDDLKVFVMGALGHDELGNPAELEICFNAWHPRLVATIRETWDEGADVAWHSGRPKYYPSKTFSVKADVCNQGDEPAHDVYATLELPDGISLVDDFLQKYLGKELLPTECREVKWTVHCDEAEPGGTLETIKVIPSGNNDITGEPITNIEDGETTVYQFPREHIEVVEMWVEEMDPRECGPINDEVADDPDKNGIVAKGHQEDGGEIIRIGTSTCYRVYAEFHNDGYADLENVEATLSYRATFPGGENHLEQKSDPVVIREGQLHQDESWTVEWLFHCPEGADTLDEEERYYITFEVDVVGDSEICYEQATAEDELVIVQKDLVVEITEPENGKTVSYGFPDPEDKQCFPVVADIYNRELTLGWDLTEVQLEIELPDGMMLDESTPDAVVEFDTLYNPHDPSKLGELSKETAEWLVCCTGPTPADAMIRVFGSGKTASSSQPRNNHDFVKVVQQHKATLEAEFTAPEPDTWYGLGEIFEVTAVIRNVGEGDATGVMPNFEHSPFAQVIEADEGPFDIDGNKSANASWLMQCTGPCPVEMEINPTGVDVNSELEIPEENLTGDTLKVYQSPLELEIYQYPTEDVLKGDTFGISAKVKNLSNIEDPECPKCVMKDVVATIEVETGMAVLAQDENATKVLEEVLPNEDDESYGRSWQDVEWTLRCWGPGVVKIRVTIETTRECEEDGGELLAEPVKTSSLIFFKQVDRPTKYTICMEKNWNLISLPVQPHAFDAPDLPLMDQIEALLMPIKSSLYEVWTYEGGEWLRFMYDDPTSDLMMMKDGQGYFVRMYWPDCLDGQGSDHCTTAGVGNTPPEYAVDEGWNLIGVTVCDCNGDGVIDDADVNGDGCCYRQLECVDCGKDGKNPCDNEDGLTADKYLASMNVGGQINDLVYGDEARIMRWWEPWGGFVADPLVNYKAGAMWHTLAQCDYLWPGMGYWMKASLPGLYIVPPVPGGCD